VPAEIDQDREKRRAIDALVHRLRNKGDADDEPFAAEFIAALWGQGWRPTLAKPLPDWHYRGHGEAPDASKPGGADYLAAKAGLLARAEDRAAGAAPDGGEQP
jgi:hypothetical protein